MPPLVLGSVLVFFSGVRSTTQFAGRSELQAYCLRFGGLARQSLSRVNNPG